MPKAVIVLAFVANTVLWALLLWARLKRRTLQREFADHAPSATVLSLMLTALVIWLVVRHHRYGTAAVVGLFDAVWIAQAVYGWRLRHKVEDKWQPWY